MYKVAVASLGCSKNLVDSERMLGDLKFKGYELVDDEGEADIIIVNTCCFIEDAKLESIDVILELARYKNDKCKSLIVTGCMAERYRDEVLKEFPEVDCVVAIGSDITAAIEMAGKGMREVVTQACDLSGERVLATPQYTAYLKIAEGCDNNCTYCVIPSIRGGYISRPIEDVVTEAKALLERGVKEIIVIAQDTTGYGVDLYGECKIVELVSLLCQMDFEWIRLQYCYPERITDELIDLISKQDKICKYLDLPIQHSEDAILTRMGRLGSKAQLTDLINRIREKVPEMILRTTIIVGFPGETEKDFDNLCDFVQETKFDRLGVFAYSQEEGTPAAEMEEQIDEQIKKHRQEAIMLIQDEVAYECSQKRIGQRLKVLIEGYDEIIKQYYGRTYADSPEVDGMVFIKGEKGISAGTFTDVLIEDFVDYDLYGRLV